MMVAHCYEFEYGKLDETVGTSFSLVVLAIICPKTNKLDFSSFFSVVLGMLLLYADARSMPCVH